MAEDPRSFSSDLNGDEGEPTSCPTPPDSSGSPASEAESSSTGDSAQPKGDPGEMMASDEETLDESASKDLSGDDIAERSHLSEALEDYLYVHGFVGNCRLGSLVIPPIHPLDPAGTTLDSLIQYWLGIDRRRYASLPFFVRKAKVNAAHQRELRALRDNLVPLLDPPYTRQSIEDSRNLFLLMDAFDRITGIQNRVRRLLKQDVANRLPGIPSA